MFKFYTIFLSLILLSNQASQAQIFQDDFGTTFGSISTTNWPTSCRSGSPSSFNTSIAPCASSSERAYSFNGSGTYITTSAIAIPASGAELTFDYSYNSTSSFPVVEIRTGASCGTTLASSTTLASTSGTCKANTISLSSYANQTIYIRFVTKGSAIFYLDEVVVKNAVAGAGNDFKFADNFNDNNLVLNYAGNDGDEACTNCGDWATTGVLTVVPSSSWKGNSRKTEAFPATMPNVYYVKLDRNKYIESPVINTSAMTGLKISFYAKSSASGSGGGDSWSPSSDHLRLQIWSGSSWITVKDITEGTSTTENKISPAIPFNYFCFTAYNSASAPGNYYYTSTPNVNAAYFHKDFKFRVIFEGGFSGAPFAWVDDFTFRADADGYSTMIPCGLSFWNEPAATGYGRDPEASSSNHSARGVELELDGSINFPPNWASQANDGNSVSQVFGSGESERVVFCVLSEQEIKFTHPKVSFNTPFIGNRSATMSIDNNYTGPGWKYYAIEHISCDLANSSISKPTDQFSYHYVFEYGNEFIPVFYHLNRSGIETGGGATSSWEQFDAPDVISSDSCGLLLSTSLLSFNAVFQNNTVAVNWQTTNESQLEAFELERSSDGLYFDKINWQATSKVNQSITNYQYTDSNYGSSNYVYYRLKQLDKDGSFSYSNVIAVELPKTITNFHLSPNPTNDALYISIPATAQAHSLNIVIYNNLGILVDTYSFSNLEEQNILEINTKNLSKGIYVVQLLLDGTHSQTQRFIKR